MSPKTIQITGHQPTNGTHTNNTYGLSIQFMTGSAGLLFFPYTIFHLGIHHTESFHTAQNKCHGMFGNAASVDTEIDIHRNSTTFDFINIKHLCSDTRSLNHLQIWSGIKNSLVNWETTTNQKIIGIINLAQELFVCRLIQCLHKEALGSDTLKYFPGTPRISIGMKNFRHNNLYSTWDKPLIINLFHKIRHYKCCHNHQYRHSIKSQNIC